MSGIVVKTYSLLDVDEQEILHYANSKEGAEIDALLSDCLKEVLPKLSYKVCYREFSLSEWDTLCGEFPSKHLQNLVLGKQGIVLFCATLGIEIDRLIAKYEIVSPAKAVLLQAIGTERIEALCDVFCQEIAKEKGAVTPRFSPGYGDLSLQTQKKVFELLEISKRLGIGLSDGLLMTPTKSVTAFLGYGHSRYALKGEK